MASKLQKWGNSIGLRIPKAIIEKANLDVDSEVEVEHRDGKIIISPVRKTPQLSELLAQITNDNIHFENDETPEGNEVW